MRYRVLGPIEVLDGGVATSIAAAKERRLLAALLAEANRVVSPSRLIDELWGDKLPRTAAKTLQTYVSHLRRVVGSDLVTSGGGYQLVGRLRSSVP